MADLAKSSERIVSLLHKMASGIICLWYGVLIDIPPGWKVCDGTLGTPNLEDTFLIGAGDTYNPDDSHLVPFHNHTVLSDLHTHTWLAGATAFLAGAFSTATLSLNVLFGFSDNTIARPPFKALHFIQRI